MEAEAEAGSGGADRTRLGLWIFVLSLGALFAAGIVLFVMARTGGGGHLVRDTQHGARISLPLWIWASTLFVFCSSVALHQALQWARMGLPGQATVAFRGATALGWGFAILQVPGLLALIGRYRGVEGARPIAVFLVVALSGLHLLHAAGGVAAMTRLAVRAGRVPLDGSVPAAWGHMAVYWHFLAAVWLALFATFALVR